MSEPVRPEQAPYRDGAAGGSASEEHDRRRGRREQRARDRWGSVGVAVARVTGDPQSTRAWESGAAGERRVGRLLDEASGPGLRVLHDRRVPGSRANIDHLVIAPAGVFVIDAKRYVNQRPEQRHSQPFGLGEELLYVGGRNRTALVQGVQRQAGRVAAALPAGVPVRAVLCFVDGDWPLFAGPFDVAGVRVTYPRGLRKELDRPGPLRIADLQSLQRLLASAFPAYGRTR